MSARGNRLKKKIAAFATAVVFVVFAASLINEKLGLIDIPTTDDVYSSAGLSDKPSVTSDFAVHFIDVGQGDCILITSSGGNMLIDAGESENEQTVLDYLDEHGVKTLDYVVATHPHSDHIGSLAGVIDSVTVKNIIMPKLTAANAPTTRCYEQLLTAVKNSGANVIAAVPNSRYSLGEVHFTVLSPFRQDENLNNMSVVIKLIYQTKKFLFMGDAEKEVEKQLIANGCDLSADVIKLGHHGSSTSSSKEFIKAVMPSYAIIMCGNDNKYGHPHNETVELLEKLHIKSYRTDIDGTIVIGVENSQLVGV